MGPVGRRLRSRPSRRTRSSAAGGTSRCSCWPRSSGWSCRWPPGASWRAPTSCSRSSSCISRAVWGTTGSCRCGTCWSCSVWPGSLSRYAIARLPGRGGHIPVHGLTTGAPAEPVELPGILLAAVGTIGFGLVLGPEAPLIAPRHRPGDPDGPGHATRGARSGAARRRGRRKLRRAVVHLRLAAHRGGDPHRGRRPRRRAAARSFCCRGCSPPASAASSRSASAR